MLALSVRFTCKDEASAAAYDELVAATVAAIRANEPGTLIYAVHRVDGAPLQRIFYELYTDQAAFEAHEAAPHIRRYLAAREEFLVSTEVDRLTLLTSGLPFGLDDDTLRHRFAIYRKDMLALRDYRPGGYDAPVHLVRALESPPSDVRTRLRLEHVIEHEVPGGHERR